MVFMAAWGHFFHAFCRNDCIFICILGEEFWILKHYGKVPVD